MTQELPNDIAIMTQNVANLIPANPGLKDRINAKLAILRDPGLSDVVVHDCRYVVDTVELVDGRAIPIVALYPLASMRDEAWRAVELLKEALPVEESFTGKPLPAPMIHVWYGFAIGNDSAVDLEDEAGYEARWHTPMPPYDAIPLHELGHSWIRHEGLNQFLELYTYNTLVNPLAAPKDWTYTKTDALARSPQATAHALFDVYQIIGLDAMKSAYRSVQALNPPYGKPLPDEVKQAFIDASAPSLQAKVKALVANLTY
jgi:hypothetical protein